MPQTLKDNYWEIVDCTGRGVQEAADVLVLKQQSSCHGVFCMLLPRAIRRSCQKSLLKAFRRREKRLQKTGRGCHFGSKS
ncbi:MAG: hypothetical protein R2822_17725 [Spirosomataceae bacterium]